MVNTSLVLILLGILLNPVFALDKFWGEAYLGERQAGLYAGNNEPIAEKNKSQGFIIQDKLPEYQLKL